MRLRLALACGLAALLAACQAGLPPTSGCVLGRAAILPLRDDGHALHVVTRLNGQPTDLLLDTGADTTIIAKDAAAGLNLSLVPVGTVTGIGGASPGYLFIARRFELGRLYANRLLLAAGDFHFVPGSGDAVGLLGDNLLASYDLDLDLQDRQAILYRPQAGCHGPVTTLKGGVFKAPLLAALQPRDPHPYVGVTIGGVTLRAVVDTAAPTSLLFRDAAARVGVKLDDLAGDPRFMAGGVGPGRVAAVHHVLAPVAIGELTVHNLPVVIVDQASLPGVDMLLGLDLLRRLHAWFSFSSHTFVMQYPPQSSAQ